MTNSTCSLVLNTQKSWEITSLSDSFGSGKRMHILTQRKSKEERHKVVNWDQPLSPVHYELPTFNQNIVATLADDPAFLALATIISEQRENSKELLMRCSTG